MRQFYAFNGDADGLCALQQLRLVDPRPATLVTGVKRDILLLKRIAPAAGDEVTALDISLDANRDDVLRLLAAGASLRYFDHHYAGELPRHPALEAWIEESAEVCTSTLVDRYLEGRHRRWAIAAAFGDNLKPLGRAMAAEAGLDAASTIALEELGIALNYNAYGDTLADLAFDPAELAQTMLPFADPMDFVRDAPAFPRLRARYEDDMLRARALMPARRVPGATMVILPDEAWARRAIGVLANELTLAEPDCAIAILSPRQDGGYTVSLRVPRNHPVAADAFCREFGSGGGRRLAAGINRLPASDVDRFASMFEARFGTH